MNAGCGHLPFSCALSAGNFYKSKMGKQNHEPESEIVKSVLRGHI